MKEKVARMSQVKRCIGQRISEKVMASHLHAIAGERLEQASVEIGRQHRPRSADALGQQPRDGALPGADVEAMPSLGHTDRVELTDREWIVALRQ